MLQVARLAPRLLGESAPLVEAFLRSRQNPDGGFSDRDGKSDLYYTVFALDGLAALQAELPLERVEPYLRAFGDGAGLDLVHLGCLARAWASFPPARRAAWPGRELLARIECHRAADGGYEAARGAAHGTLYGNFIALGAYQDVGVPMPRPEGVLACLDRLRTADGGYTNHVDMPHGLTPPTAAAVVLLRTLGRQADADLGRWLLGRCRRDGGFFASPLAPIPDLLSTATALHALDMMHVDYSQLVEPCLDFLDTLWSARGGFCGSWEDDMLDCEYTYYGLLALGHLVR